MAGLHTVESTLEAARRALKAGDVDQAAALKRRAEAIKSGTLAEFERTADLTAQALAALPQIRKARAANLRADRMAMDATKALAVAALDPEVEKLADELHDGDYGDAHYRKALAVARYIRSGTIADEGAARSVVLSPGQIATFIGEGLSGSEIKAAMAEAQDTLGGVLVSGGIAEEIMARAATLSVVRPRATVVNPATQASLAIVRVTGSGDVYSSTLRGVWQSEAQNTAAENLTLGLSKPPINLWKVKVRLSKSLLEDAGPQIMRILVRFGGEAIAVAEDASFLVGSGAGQPRGILATNDAGLINPDVRVTNSGNATDISADGVISAIYSLPAQYRSAPGFCVTCAAATVKRLRTLKDAAARYLFDDRDHTLLGYPLVESEQMPAIASGAYPLLAGDFGGYGILDRVALGVERWDDSSLADTDSVRIDLRKRLGGDLSEGYRFSALKVSV